MLANGRVSARKVALIYVRDFSPNRELSIPVSTLNKVTRLANGDFYDIYEINDFYDFYDFAGTLTFRMV